MGNRSSSSKSLLPEDVIVILNKGMSEGFRDDCLGLCSKNINDSMMPELCKWIVKLGDNVKTLNLSKNQIASVGASMLFDTLKIYNLSMKYIYLSGNRKIDYKCMKSLGEYIKSNKSIQIILLNDTSISDAGIEILAPYLDGSTTFKELSLSTNQRITDKSIQLLMKMIESSCIENIGINGTSITQKNSIYTSLFCNRTKNGSTNLLLPEIDISDDDLIKICDAMKKYGIDKLQTIKYWYSLSENYITSRGASALFDALKECNSVVSELDFSWNRLDDECMKQLGEYIQNNEHLKKLQLGLNRVTDKGIEILSVYLIGNTTLKELNLRCNEGITDASAPHLTDIAMKSCITKLELRFTSISQEKQQEIEEALSIPIDQREIPIKSNTKSAAKIPASA